MENKNVIIILVAIVLVLAVVLGVMFLQPTNAKEATKLKITSNKTLYEGDSIVVQLTDLNKTPLSKEKLNIKIANSKGKLIINKTIKTNSKGKAKLDWDLKKGKYEVNVTYKGNENYTGNNTTQKLTIKEAVTESVSQESYSSSSSSSDSGGYDHYSQQYGTYIKQYTDSNGVQHIEGANGMHESYDPSTGMLSGTDANCNEYQDHMG